MGAFRMHQFAAMILSTFFVILKAAATRSSALSRHFFRSQVCLYCVCSFLPKGLKTKSPWDFFFFSFLQIIIIFAVPPFWTPKSKRIETGDENDCSAIFFVIKCWRFQRLFKFPNWRKLSVAKYRSSNIAGEIKWSRNFCVIIRYVKLCGNQEPVSGKGNWRSF